MNKKRIYVIVSVVIVICIYGIAVFRANRDVRKPVYKYYDKGEECEYMDGSIKIIDSDIYSMEDFRKKYSIDKADFSGYIEDENTKCVVTKAQITKITDKSKDELSVNIGRYTRENCAYETDFELFDLLNPDYNYSKLKKGESVQVLIPVCMLSIHFRKSDWDNLFEKPLYLTYYDYKGHEYISKLRVN